MDARTLAAAAVFALAAVFFSARAIVSIERVAELQDQATQQQAELERAREVVSTLTSTDAQRVTLIAAQTLPQPQGKAIYVRDRPAWSSSPTTCQPCLHKGPTNSG